MKKAVLAVLILSVVIGLFAQQQQQQKKTGGKKKKVNWETEYYQMEKKYNSTHGAYQTLTKEHERMRKENKTLKANKAKS